MKSVTEAGNGEREGVHGRGRPARHRGELKGTEKQEQGNTQEQDINLRKGILAEAGRDGERWEMPLSCSGFYCCLKMK